jgi:hypothetical protein
MADALGLGLHDNVTLVLPKQRHRQQVLFRALSVLKWWNF